MKKPKVKREWRRGWGWGWGESNYKEQEELSLQILSSRKKYKQFLSHKSDDAVKWTNSAKTISTQRMSIPPQSPEQRSIPALTQPCWEAGPLGGDIEGRALRSGIRDL